MPETTRKKMIQKLSSIPYAELWPGNDWDDIGFTESRIWVNGKGYGSGRKAIITASRLSKIYVRPDTKSFEHTQV